MSRGRKVQRHACSVTGTQQYRRMESNSANAPSANGSTGVEAAGKAGERKTNAPNLFKAPQAAEERETNVPCQRETAENTGTRETNVSEKDTAVARRNGDAPAIAEQQRRQGIAAADKPPNQAQKGAIVMDTPQTTGVGSGDGARTGGCRPNIPDASRAGTPARGVGTLRGLGGGTLGQDLRLPTCPLGLQGGHMVPGLTKFNFF